MKNKKIMQQRCEEFGMLCKVIFWLTAVYTAALVVMGIWIGIHPESDFTVALSGSAVGLTGTASFSGIEYGGVGASILVAEFEQNVLSNAAQENPKTVFLVGFVGRIATTVIILLIFWCLRRIFQNIDKFGTPFCRENTKLIAWMGILFIVNYYVKNTIIPLLCMAFGFGGGNFELINFGVLLLAAPLFCLSYIFDYGSVLQQEADETL